MTLLPFFQYFNYIAIGKINAIMKSKDELNLLITLLCVIGREIGIKKQSDRIYDLKIKDVMKAKR